MINILILFQFWNLLSIYTVLRFKKMNSIKDVSKSERSKTQPTIIKLTLLQIYSYGKLPFFVLNVVQQNNMLL